MSTLSSLPVAFSFFNLSSLEGSLTMAIPILAIVMPFVFVIIVACVKIVNDRKTRQLQHETIRIALEKGQPVPPELLKEPESTEVLKMLINSNEGATPGANDRKTGLILIAVGIGLYFFFAESGGFMGMDLSNGLRWIALIPGLIGIALLINWLFEGARKNNEKK